MIARPFSFREDRELRSATRVPRVLRRAAVFKAWYAVKCDLEDSSCTRPAFFCCGWRSVSSTWEAAPRPHRPQTSRPLELRLEAGQVGEQDIPETMVITLVNSGDHEVRLPKPTMSCGDSYSGEVWLRLKFTPLKQGERQTGRGCFLDSGVGRDIADRVKNWKILKPGDTLAFRVTVGTDFNRSIPGRYEFYADYKPPYLKPEDQRALHAMGIDFPHEALQSLKMIFTKPANAQNE